MESARVEDAADLERELGRWDRLEECLLVGMALTHHGYSVRLDFDHIWASEGVIRQDLAQTERRVTIEMHAVQRLHIEGGLSRAMLEHRDRIDWGLSEDMPDLAALRDRAAAALDVAPLKPKF